MSFQKGFIVRRFIKNKYLVLNLLLLVFVFSAVIARANGENIKSSELNVYLPINNVDTKETVYSLTLNLLGKEDEENVKLISQILKGMKIKATFFVRSQWVEDNYSLGKKIIDDGHSFGLLINNKKTSLMGRGALDFLAEENSMFLKHFGNIPKCVRIEMDKSGKISEMIGAFGQTYVSYSSTFDLSSEIKNGDIVLITVVSSTIPYDVAEYVGENIKNNFTAIPLCDLLSLNNIETSNN